MQGLQRVLLAAFKHVFLYATGIPAVTAIGSFRLKEIPLRTR
jgi:hypothetical protein